MTLQRLELDQFVHSLMTICPKWPLLVRPEAVVKEGRMMSLNSEELLFSRPLMADLTVLPEEDRNWF